MLRFAYVNHPAWLVFGHHYLSRYGLAGHRPPAPTRQGTLGPVDSPPYYAVRVSCGALGTKGGPRTDAQGRVLDVDDDVIEGLYATGTRWVPSWA